MERGDTGSGGGGGGGVIQQVLRLTQILNSPNATANQKAEAVNMILQLQRSNGPLTGEIQQILQSNGGWMIRGNEIVYGEGANPPVQSSRSDDMSAQTIDPNAYSRSKWASARQAVDNMSGLKPGANVAPDGRSIGAPGVYATGGGSTPGSSYDVGTSTADANSVGASMDGYDNTFFSGIQSGALNDVANNPNAAAALWRTRGGPGGGSLANSSASIYGEDDFMAAMNMAELMGNPNQVMAPQDKLKFTNDWMGNAQQGGNYVDPGKLASQLLGNIGQVQDPFMQEELIDKAISALRPYMTDTSFKMLSSRLNRISDEYTTYGLENGTADLSNVLLNEVYKALGV